MLSNSLFDMPVTAIPDLPRFSGKFIYETKGRAREYMQLACNLYTGCDHKCVYCYAPNVLQRERPTFYQVVNPRSCIIENIEKESKKYVRSGETRQVLFCFACDPYSQADVVHQLTRQAIQVMHRNGMSVCTLTKGGKRALRDLDLFTGRDTFASTLTTLDDAQSKKWEPGAALPQDRMDTISKFHAAGIPTWVSLEPVLDPDWTYEIIRQTHAFVDEYKVGILNYHPLAKQINWTLFARKVKNLLDDLGCRYYLKEDLRRYL